MDNVPAVRCIAYRPTDASAHKCDTKAALYINDQTPAVGDLLHFA